MCSWQPPGVRLKQLVLRPEAENDKFCISMVTPELDFTDKLHDRQWANDPFWVQKLKIFFSKISHPFILL